MNTNKTQAEQLPQDAVMQSVISPLELRMGNLVYILKKDNMKLPKYWWEEHFIDEYDFPHINEDAYYPILLTEEKLLSFGFEKVFNEIEKDYEFHLIVNENIFLCYYEDFSCGIYASKTELKEALSVSPHIRGTKTVHGLQNLIFSLTQKELINVNRCKNCNKVLSKDSKYCTPECKSAFYY